MVNLRHAIGLARHGDWEKAHALVQTDESLLGAWLHGILHCAEGDLDNARYWYSKAQRNFAQRGDITAELGKLEDELVD